VGQPLLRLAAKARFPSIESTKVIGYPPLLSTDCPIIRRRWNQWSRSSAFHSAAIRPSAHLPTQRSPTSTNAAWPKARTFHVLSGTGIAMNSKPTLSAIAAVVSHSPIVVSRSVHPCFFLHGYEHMDLEILEWIATASAARGSTPFVN
jgi:hypothetical protein